MENLRKPFNCRNSVSLMTITVVLIQVLKAASISVPLSNCYALDNSSHIVDFTSWIGHAFEYEGKDADLVVRFCKDVESRSQTGYVNFGRFDALNYFTAGSGLVNFVQGFYKGDLMNCERSYDKMGRTAEVNIICGSCLNGRCKGELGCICNVTYESTCRVLVELAIPCEKQGPRVFEGFTVGFHPRSWEVVYNGMAQLGFEKLHHEFSFSTEQTRVALYMTAVASLSRLVGKPTLKISPENGLEVRLLGSAAAGRPPTTLSPAILLVDWTCLGTENRLFEVVITIPVESYEPIQFTLTKSCEYQQSNGKEATQGWAIFGVASFIFFVLFTLVCCGGFFYRVRFQNQRGLDALPGMTILSACLQTVTGGTQGYQRAEDDSNPFINQAPRGNQSATARGPWRQTEIKYGSIGS